MTRVLEDGPCLADPTSSCRSLGTTGEDIPVSHEGLPNRSVRLCMELARALLDPNWKYSSALRTLEELVLEQLMNYGSRAPSWRVKNSRVHLIRLSSEARYTNIYICIQLNKKKKGNLSLESSKFTKYNFLFFLIFFSRSTNASRVEDSLYIV